MNRRDFLKAAAATPAAVLLGCDAREDPETTPKESGIDPENTTQIGSGQLNRELAILDIFDKPEAGSGTYFLIDTATKQGSIVIVGTDVMVRPVEGRPNFFKRAIVFNVPNLGHLLGEGIVEQIAKKKNFDALDAQLSVQGGQSDLAGSADFSGNRTIITLKTKAAVIDFSQLTAKNTYIFPIPYLDEYACLAKYTPETLIGTSTRCIAPDSSNPADIVIRKLQEEKRRDGSLGRDKPFYHLTPADMPAGEFSKLDSLLNERAAAAAAALKFNRQAATVASGHNPT